MRAPAEPGAPAPSPGDEVNRLCAVRAVHVTAAIVLLSTGVTSNGHAAIPCADRSESALPADAYYVAPGDALRIPLLLHQHHRIRLAPGADYRASPTTTVRSNEAIYGAAGTRMSTIVVAPGTHNAIVSGVVPAALEFPPSDLPTSQNCFERFAARTYAQSPLTLRGAVVEDNLFLDVARVVVDTSQSGRVVNNRFIRTLVHGESPALFLRGRGRHSEDNNVFLWMNVLGPVGDGVIIQGEAQVNIIGLDAENWNQHGQATHAAMMAISDTRLFRGFVLQGGAQLPSPTRYLDVSASEVQLAGMRVYRAASPAVTLDAAVSRFANLMPINVNVEDRAGAAGRLIAYENGGGGVSVRHGEIPEDDGPGRPSGSWEAPHLDQPSDTDRRALSLARRRSAEDSREYLQSLIDRDKVAFVPAGTYYVSGPLRLKTGEGLIGAGAGRTIIIAKSRDIDLIEGADHYDRKQTTTFSLVDLTLQGGRIGIRHDEAGAGKGAQFNLIHLSHVVIRDMSQAGISIAGIYGWDNNLIDHVTFYGMPVAIQQTPSAWYISSAVNGDVEGMNYMDKNVFYRCRFDRVGIGMELTAKRANGLNACIECRFEHNEVAAIRATYNVSTVVANSDFVDNGGDPVIASNMPIGIVGSRFVGGSGNSFLDTDAICEGCTFTRSGAGATSIGRKGARVLLIDSRSAAVPLGPVTAGLFIDTALTETAKLHSRVVELRDGQAVGLVPGTPKPTEQLLGEWSGG